MPKQVLEEIKQSYLLILKRNLVGIYVHGSLAFGCFNEKQSDIDFIVVVNEVPSLEEKKDLIKVLLELRKKSTLKKYEMSVVLKEDCQKFKYPTPYVLHYSEAHIVNMEKNLTKYCQKMNGYDYDLAAHFTIVKEKGYAVYGERIESVFGEVAETYYWDSIKRDISFCKEDILTCPTYIILNLCRVLAYKREKKICSKAEGGTWGIKNLKKHENLISQALKDYLYNCSYFLDKSVLQSFAEELLTEIEKESRVEDVRCDFK